jgi:ABC-type transporter Mla subunit MlaD
MGGGDNELTIKTILDLVGFEKGSKQLANAIKGISDVAQKTFGRIEKSAKQIERGIGQVTGRFKSFFASIVGAASVFGIISKAVSTFMSQNQQLTRQMNAAWTALGNALGPIITEVINLFTKAISYLVTFMKLLGFTSKTASQASKAAKSAVGTLQRTLAGFDEINKLNAPQQGNGTLQDIEPSEFMSKLAELLKNGMWEKAGEWIAQKINEIIDRIDFAKIAQKISNAIKNILDFLIGFIRGLDFKKIGAAIREFFMNIDWKGIKEKIIELLREVWNGAMDFLWGLIAGDSEEEPPIIAVLRDIGNSALDLIESIDKLLEALKPFWGWFSEHILSPVLTLTLMLIDSILKSLKEDIENLIALLRGEKTFKEFAQDSSLASTGLGKLVQTFRSGDWSSWQNAWKTLKTLFSGTSEEMEKAGSSGHKLHETVKQMKPTLRDLKPPVQEFTDALSDNETKMDDGLSKAGSFADNFKKKLSESFGNAKKSMSDNGTAMFQSLQKNFNSIEAHTKSSMAAFGNSIRTSFASAVSSISLSMGNIRNAVAVGLGNISYSSYYWGRDMIDNFWYGISSRLSNFYANIRNVAQGIADFLGFSEPKEGPLSNFHTYGPDMMDLYASGINSEKDKVFEAVNSVAEGIADGLGGTSLPVSAVASGAVTPYSVGASTTGGIGGADIVSQISAAVYNAVLEAMGQTQGSGSHTAILQVNGREFCRATYYDQQAVAKEHGVAMIVKG